MKEESKKLIGRGLVDLIDEHRVDDVLEGEVVTEIKLEEIKPNPYQPRRVFDAEKISELAQSIKEHGVFQPIIVKKIKDGYLIVSGERRYRAVKQVGLSTIPAIVRPYEEQKVAEIALVENLQREDLTPLEEAEAYLNIMNHLKLTQGELADKIGKSRSHITNMLGLLNLPSEVQDYLLVNKLSMGHARALSKLSDHDKIVKLARKVIKEGLSVRSIEVLTQKEEKTKAINRVKKESIFKDEISAIYEKHQLKVEVKNHKVIIEASDEEKIREILKKIND
jgi:ParB family chromosome partitioning protein